MSRLTLRLPVIVAAAWWGSLTTIGFLVVPLLFQNLPTPAMAGGMAAHLFTAQTWVSIACSLLLLMLSAPDRATGEARQAPSTIMFIVLGLLMALLVEFGIAPRIVARDNLKLWHAVGSSMYLVQWVCTALVLWRLTGPATPLSRTFDE
jgi:hypothetical protein